jgi:isopenicillin-N epimerase
MVDRRGFLGAVGAPAVGIAASLEFGGLASALEAVAFRGGTGTPEETARDEDFWVAVQRAFKVDRTLINLNNGGVSPAVESAQEALKRYLDYSNLAPAYTMWRILEPQKEKVRGDLARIFGCDPEEMAITRNASEGLETCQLGFDLEPGDEVLTTNQDYPRMLNTWKQLSRRKGVVLRQFSLPVPAEDEERIVRLFEENVSPRTRLILMCHMINLTGQILPVRKVVAMARRRGIPVIVDGAHTFAHFPFSRADLDCDYFAASLHKWLFAPHGTGMLYVKRDRIEGLWPLMPCSEGRETDIRKFEEIGTHPAANFLSIAEAVLFHEGVGPERKAARMRYLRDYWATRLAGNARVYLNTSLDPRFSCGLGNFRIDGIDSVELGSWLWAEHRILTTPVKHDDFEGIRVTPSLYTTLTDLDRFCGAVEGFIRRS